MKGHKFMKRDEFRTYAASLRDKSTKFKRLKAELNEMRHEAAILLRTEQNLSARDPTPAGLRETEKSLEKTSMAKATVDKAKGETLEEMSSIVQKINNLLKDKKNKLAPLIKSLRTVRQTYQIVEGKYLEKKNVYDAVKVQVDQDYDRTLAEVEKLQSDVTMFEQKFHQLNVLTTSVDARIARADNELRCIQGKERYSKDPKGPATLGAVYTNEINKLEQVSRELRKQQKEVKESYESNRAQRTIMSQLADLMSVKLRVAQHEATLSQGGHVESYGRTAVDVSSGAVNRMIISD